VRNRGRLSQKTNESIMILETVRCWERKRKKGAKKRAGSRDEKRERERYTV